MDVDEYQFGPEWGDDQKMSVLFAPFREKSLNPQSWDKKIKFWTQLILKDFKKNNEFILDVNSLVLRFVRKGKKPACLETVIQEMLRMKKLQTLQDFHQSCHSGWVSWGMTTFVKRPLNWSLGFVLKSNEEVSGQLIIVEHLQDMSARLLEDHYDCVNHESTDNIVEMTVLQDQHRSLCKTDSDLNLILTQLEKNKKIVRMKIGENDVIIKFCKKNEQEVKPIQELELNVFRIQKVKRNLEKQIEALSPQIDRHTQDAQLHVRNGKKHMALHSLRKRQTVQKLMDKKSSTVDMLQMIIHRIEDAATNEMVLKAYESGMNAIKDLTKKTPIDKVENVIDDLQDVLEDQSEVNDILSKGAESADADVTKDELEAELEELLEEDKQQMDQDVDSLSDLLGGVTMNQHDLQLPDVPTFSPSASTSKVSSKSSNVAGFS
ncbi:charged multivesicular body protein 7-like [Gigantopelta aegis]|uniref:charged multivesicular body protein 7-like n=1 Tax=Gigantopelta aegis TaxID=1735272 RepID=UPI001B889432|nr:charged multivesicular body protein 7-like [Gigantopelta aegis]